MTIICFLSYPFNVVVADKKKSSTISEEKYKKVCRWGIFNPPECKKRRVSTSIKKNKSIKVNEQNNAKEDKEAVNVSNDPDCKWGIFNPPKCRKNYKGDKSKRNNNSKTKVNALTSGDQNISMYTGTFDILDKEGDEQTTLLGVEHKNENLFRDKLEQYTNNYKKVLPPLILLSQEKQKELINKLNNLKFIFDQNLAA